MARTAATLRVLIVALDMPSTIQHQPVIQADEIVDSSADMMLRMYR